VAKSWLRRKAETSEAYKAFLVYRDLGPDRTIEVAADAVTESAHSAHPPQNSAGTRTEPFKPLTYPAARKLSMAHKWVDRARDWDNHLQVERDKVDRARARKWEERKHQMAEAIFEDGERLRQKGRVITDLPIVEKRITTEVDADGRTVAVTVIMPVRYTQRDGTVMLRQAAEMQVAAVRAVGQEVPDLTDAQLAGILEAAGPGGEG
jgi:hypothetical protein